jgi:hypothetical protein
MEGSAQVSRVIYSISSNKVVRYTHRHLGGYKTPIHFDAYIDKH